MSSRSSSPSIFSDNDSELSSSLSEDVPEIIEGEFIASVGKTRKSHVSEKNNSQDIEAQSSSLVPKQTKV